MGERAPAVLGGRASTGGEGLSSQRGMVLAGGVGDGGTSIRRRGLQQSSEGYNISGGWGLQ